MKLDPRSVIVRPVLTERGVKDQERNNTYPFEVHPDATKEDVKNAVEETFNVHVVDVRTMRRKGKPRRTKFQWFHTAKWKKALVRIQDGETIDLF